MRYTAQPIATCLDTLFHHQAQQATANISSPALMPGELIFVFMGDSRIRQQFFNFVKVLIYAIHTFQLCSCIGLL
jgi:hypothetical protein